MRISSLLIENFRAIARAELADLGDMVVIAGANGCGKTQIYNAIRLLKSTYGGYQPNEYEQWWGEFNIRLDRRTPEVFRIFRDRNRPIRIRAEFEIAESERNFLVGNSEELLRSQSWLDAHLEEAQSRIRAGAAVAHIQRTHEAEVEKRTEAELLEIEKALKQKIFAAELVVYPNLTIDTLPSPVLELIFGTFQPGELGIIDYHGAQRNYSREQLGGINLSIESSEQKSRQHALYNWQNKYSNIKSELAAGYIRELISREAGHSAQASATLTQTLRELFQKFFPGKEFVGPVPGPNATLDFPVLLSSGLEHDIDDLSSGEKEVLFGYLRLRNNALKNSIVLIDEPELHLNPALIQGLPQFYHQHIGRALSNQVWLTTHSDALLREAVSQTDISVYHMHSIEDILSSGNQLRRLGADEALDDAILNLVGDLATYRPGAKVVFFEGGGEANFDVRMTAWLFPELKNSANLIALGSNAKVDRVHDLLREAAKKGSIGARFYSVVDRDSGQVERAADAYTWDRYHIENYLLEPKCILLALDDLQAVGDKTNSEEKIWYELRECAKQSLHNLVRHELEVHVNSMLVSAIKTRAARAAGYVYPNLHAAIRDSQARMNAAVSEDLSIEKLKHLESSKREKFEEHLGNGCWIKTVRGRDILKLFVCTHVRKVKYEVFRDIILARMRDQQFKPEGMLKVVNQIL